MNCKQCDDKIIVEGEGCPKCNNEFCGACCEWDNTPICGDHLVTVVECGCDVYFNYKRKRVSK